MIDEDTWLRRHAWLCFEPRPDGDPDPDYRRLHQHLCQFGAYAYILVQTSYGTFPFLLQAVPGSWRMIAGEVPDLRGDPCKHCPGWGRAWDAKHRRPYWFHWAHGPTWVRPVGWRGTDYPFPIIVLRRHFCDWWDNAAVERMRRTFCWNLCQRTFRHWESLWAYTSMDDMCFEYADFGCDGTDD